jgi:hypothetical protein
LTKLAKMDHWVSGGAIRYRVVGPVQNPTAIEMSVDYAKAPVPTHFYVADYLFVDDDQSQIMLTFGKVDKPLTDRLRSKVEVYFNPALFVQQLLKSSREFEPILRKYVTDRGLTPPRWEKLLEAPKVQTYQSNHALMMLSEGESFVDFFYMSPKDMYYKPRLGEKLELEPLIRVILTPELLTSFFDAIQPLSERLKAKYGDHDAHLELERANQSG